MKESKGENVHSTGMYAPQTGCSDQEKGQFEEDLVMQFKENNNNNDVLAAQ